MLDGLLSKYESHCEDYSYDSFTQALLEEAKTLLGGTLLAANEEKRLYTSKPPNAHLPPSLASVRLAGQLFTTAADAEAPARPLDFLTGRRLHLRL